MDSVRLVIAQFCDDIRHEVGNKFSFMGCYSDEMILDKLPTVLPKLCARVQVMTPVDRPFARLTIRANLNGDCLAEIEMPITSELKESYQRKAPKADLGRLSIQAMIVISPLVVSEECRLNIEAETEDGITQGSYLLIRESKPDDSPMI